MSIESRRAPRFAVNLDVDTQVVNKDDQFFHLVQGNNFRIKAVDVSILGLGIMCKFFLPNDLELELKINSRKGQLNKDIKVRGLVRHCRYIREFGYKCGIEFKGLSQEDKTIITESFKNRDEKDR